MAAVSASAEMGNWTYQYFDDFQTDKAKAHSYTHSVFWPSNAFPPSEPYLTYLPDGPGNRVLAFMDYTGEPSHLGYCFPIASAHVRRKVSGILEIDVQFPDNAHVSQSPPGYLLYSLSSDGHNWSTPTELPPGHSEIPLESVQGTCYVIFLGARVTIDNLAVNLVSQPATIHVPADYATIQAAINAANARAVLEVGPGTYTGPGNHDIEFEGKALTVRSANGPEETIIDCAPGSGPGGPGSGVQHRGFYFHQAETADSVLRGFTIMNGRINGSMIPPDDMLWNLKPTHPVGGGIYCEYSSPTLVDCVVRNCRTEIGGGIGCVGSQPRILDCLIEECTAGGAGAAESGGRGGAIGLVRNAQAAISNCVLRNNTAYHNGSGGAIYARRAGAKITDCEILSNGPFVADGFIIGGGAYASDPQTDLMFSNCVFSNNAAVGGSAIYAQRGTSIPDCSEVDCPPCRVRLTNCTVAHNRVISGPSAAAAVQSDRADIKLKNCIVWYNQIVEIFLIGPLADAVVFCDVEGGYSGIGNIDEPPLFAPTGFPDYHLQSLYGRYYPPTGGWVVDSAHSPCIDAGDPNDPIGNEPLPNGGRINMGAYGGSTQASKSHKRTIYHVDGINGSNSNAGLSRQDAFATIQNGIDSSTHGDVVMVWPAVYTEDVFFFGKAITVQSAADAAIVVAQNEYAFSFNYTESADAVLRNFVITGSPSGIYCDNSARPTLRNLTIVGNEYGIISYPLFGAAPDISNCIFWGNTEIDLIDCTARYSCIQDPTSASEGTGNFSRDPFFADPNNLDYHLSSVSGRYWPEHNLWVIDERTSPCVDAGDPLVYPQRERMPNGGRLNVGAFGGTRYASMSQWPLRADIDRSGWVNWRDFVIFAEAWLDSLPWAPLQPDIIMPTDGSVIPTRDRSRNPY